MGFRSTVVPKSFQKKTHTFLSSRHHGAIDRELRFRGLVPPDGSVGKVDEKDAVLSQGRRSPNPRGDGRWTYRTTVRRHEILRRRIRAGEYLGVAAIRHRVFAHFIWSFYDFKLHSV